MPPNICPNCFKTKGNYDVCPHCGWLEGTFPEPAYFLCPGVVLSERYLIGTVIGYGGFGAIYKSWDSRLGTAVAVKEFYPSGLVSRVPGEKQVTVFSGDKMSNYHDGLERFLTEARNMAQFSTHPHIVNVLNFFEENNTAYIVMEYLDGISLSDYLVQCGGRLPPDEAVQIVLPIIEALTDIHNAGVLHRDIHPGNIFLTASNQIKLLDFGAARFSPGEDGKTFTVVVTPGYASPEQYRSKSKQGACTDIYGIGATLYRMVTGLIPEEAVDRQTDDRLKKPSELDIPIKTRLERTFMKALAIKPDFRFQTAKQLWNALENRSFVDFPEVEDKKRRRRRLIAIVSLSVVLAAAGIVISLFYTGSKPPESLDNTVITEDAITVWAPVNADETMASNRLNALNEIARRFEEENGQLSLAVTAFPENEYAARMSAAIRSGEVPTLFMTDFLGGGIGEVTAPLDILLNSLSKDNYLLLPDYERLFPSKREIPTGLSVAVLYGNRNATGADGPPFPEAVTDWRQFINLPYMFSVGRNGLGSVLAQYTGVSVQSGAIIFPEDMADKLVQLKQAARIKLSEGPLDMLKNDKLVFLADNTSIIGSVQEALAGHYEVIPLCEESRLIASVADCWAVSNSATKNQQNAAMLFVRFLLETYAQDRLYLQGETAIPLNKVILEQFIQSNPDLAFLENGLFASSGEYDRLLCQFGADVYDDLLMKAITEDAIRDFIVSHRK